MSATESTAKNNYRFYLCSNPNCTLRFPAPIQLDTDSLPCPRCQSPARPIPTREEVADHNPRQEGSMDVPHLEVLLDNIRSTFNVGAMLRTSDGAGVSHVHLTGITPPPTHAKITKVALGAEFAVPWTHHANGISAVQGCKDRGLQILGLEIQPDAISIFDAGTTLLDRPTLLVVGNEVTGIDPGIQELCDRNIWIPMQGYKRSLNVAVAFGIAVYTLRYGIQTLLPFKSA